MDITDVNNIYNIEVSRWESSNISCQPSHPGQNVVRLGICTFRRSCRKWRHRGKILSSQSFRFIKFEERTEAVIQCTEKLLRWSRVRKNFLEKVIIGTNDVISTVTVPLLSLVHPLCVVQDYGGNGTSYIVVLPRRNWSGYFGDRNKLD